MGERVERWLFGTVLATFFACALAACLGAAPAAGYADGVLADSQTGQGAAGAAAAATTPAATGAPAAGADDVSAPAAGSEDTEGTEGEGKDVSDSDDDPADGWARDASGAWRHYTGGVEDLGWVRDDAGWHYVDPDGVAASGWRLLGGSWYYFDPESDAHPALTGSFRPAGDSRWFAADADGRMLRGWVQDAAGWHFYEDNGAAAAGWRSLGGSWYYFDPASDAHPALTGSFRPAGDERWFAADSDGRMLRGWLQDAAGWHFYGSNGAAANRWRLLGGSWYYFDPDADAHPALTGLFHVGSEGFWADADGRLVRDAWVDLPDGTTSWADDRGALQGSATRDGDSVRLAFASGAPAQGVVTLGTSTFYCQDGRVLANQWVMVDGSWYHAGASGAFEHGWIIPDGVHYYYLDPSSGRMLTGWQQVGGRWYYLDTESGVMQVGWIHPYGNDYWCYTDANGQMHEGWLWLAGHYYYLAPGSGKMVTGWDDINGAMYYFWPSGVMATGVATIDGSTYYFNGNGSLVREGGAMVARAQGYSSSTGYLILVDTSSHHVGIFTGSRGNWTLARYMACGNGAPSTPTITGTFHTGLKGYYFDSGRARCFYFTQFSGNYLFHSVLYYQDSTPQRIMDGRVGVGVSHGCVRLELSNAKWIYDNIPYYTTVVSY